MSREKRPCMPHVKLLAEVHPRIHLCRDAALVRLRDGLSRLAWVSYEDELQLDETLLVRADCERCATCSGRVYVGYGDGLMSVEECLAVRDRINGGYNGLADGIDAITPLLGLLPSGEYLVGDFELFPAYGKNGYFWDAPANKTQIQSQHYPGDEHRDAPLYLYPSQRAANMNPEQVRAYMARLLEGDRFPRAVALYLNGSIALLLDGHHKAAAAAAAGVPVRTLVIFPVYPHDGLSAALIAQNRLYLRHGKGAIAYVHEDMTLVDGQNNVLAHVGGVQYLPSVKGECLLHTAKEIPWGRVPDEFRPKPGAFRNEDEYERATRLPLDRIQAYYHEVHEILTQRKSGPEAKWAWQMLLLLRDYAAFYPEGKGLNERQRTWLADYKE